MSLRVALAIALLGWGACRPEGTFIIVSLEADPLIPPIAEIEVVARNDGDSVRRRLSLDGRQLPATLSFEPRGRTGAIELEATAFAASGLPRAVGSGRAEIVPDETMRVSVLLSPADFVVNSEIEGDQRLAFRSGRSGRQIAARADGSFFVTFVDDCIARERCDVFARRFAPDSSPAANPISGDASAFVVDLAGDDAGAPAAAAGEAGAFVAWETPAGVRGLALTPEGARAAGGELELSPSGGGVSIDPDVAALAGGEYAVVWLQELQGGGREIRGRLVDGEGDPLVNPVSMDDGDFLVSAGTDVGAAHPAVAASGTGREFAVVWASGGAVQGRFFDEEGRPRRGTDARIATHGGDAAVVGPGIAFEPDGAALIIWGVRAAEDAALEEGAYLVRGFDPKQGQTIGVPVTIAAPVREPGAPSLAVRDDGLIGAAWQDCGERGDGSGCGIWFQAFRAGDPLEQPVRANTTTRGHQSDPAIAPVPDGFALAWSDQSAQPPDTDGDAVRARVIPIVR